ncbi:VOC family protein [Pseudohoeflea suaedae]|uniref:VOC family protein n=1 Tax=Pseudohoeflea suaedae TaxID=877384 RepID=A0A4R5PLP1_9HYPH|nr:VOC family protein [Pseudohoeflea suaedae]TDH36204.1 VOC family protein [Pseudohoeflea suaedae]
MANPRKARRLDHLVLPVPELSISRARHEALGFVVAPEARHPFGTENACVFFADGTYLEPLAIASREECEAAARAGNVFVARDQAYRFRRGENGFSALVTSSDDARADHGRFIADGISAGDMLEFSRPMKQPDGSETTASFRLAFAADLRSPDFLGFSVERIAMPAADRSALTAHENGVIGISEVVLSETNPTDFQYYVQELADNREVDAHSFGMAIELDGATINVMTPDGLKAFFGVEVNCHARGLRARGIVYRVADLARTEAFLSSRGIAPHRKDRKLVVLPEAGQGAFYAFEEGN